MKITEKKDIKADEKKNLGKEESSEDSSSNNEEKSEKNKNSEESGLSSDKISSVKNSKK